ncbi:hypothetical protein DOTSEDRAFT_74009 [Dothistroma septosporum NZE10]|uniref:Secreted protein n=1 Tax=Dothistroma septosporum (strain NZE10 / CBS 128990) TaxID=675120 RepID=N1PKH6_DOTSN|nr:hypothetical protein DOTSEDRAFT_74009 [Dothistroma septosporum NZE10]
MCYNIASFSTAALLLLANSVTVRAYYCTFYSDAACTNQVGSVSYKINNPNCFANPGHFIKCDQKEYFLAIEQYPQGQCSDTPEAVFGFPATQCTNIAALAEQNYQYKIRVDAPDLGITGNTKPKPRSVHPHDSSEVSTRQTEEDVERQDETPSRFLGSMSAKVRSTLEKRSDSCQAEVSFYYGGTCQGPAAVYRETVQNPKKSDGYSQYVSSCHNDGLYGAYILQQSTCDLIFWEGEDCSGKEHLLQTDPLRCDTTNHGEYTIRSWKWQCDMDACNDQIYK